MFRSNKRLLLTEDDQVVEPGDPRGVKLLVGEGGEVSDEDAQKYGLTDGEQVGDSEGVKSQVAFSAKPAESQPSEPIRAEDHVTAAVQGDKVTAAVSEEAPAAPAPKAKKAAKKGK